VLFFVVTPRDHNTTAVGYYIYTVNDDKIQGSPKRKASLVAVPSKRQSNTSSKRFLEIRARNQRHDDAIEQRENVPEFYS